MKKVFLAGVTVLFLATGTAHAQDQEEPKWYGDFRHCQAEKYFSNLYRRPQDGDTEVALGLDDVLELQKLIPLLRKCTAFWQCVADREAGKVKHCYDYDRRWRGWEKDYNGQ
jgi:hypothetical protein